MIRCPAPDRRAAMASERPAGDWRQQGGGKRPPVGGTSRRAWQPGAEDTRKAEGRRRSPWVRRVAAGLVTALLLGLAIWLIWFFWPARYPELVVAGGDDGSSPVLPPDGVAGLHTEEGLRDLARGGDRPRFGGTPPLAADADGVKITLDPNPKNLLVYLTAN